MEEEGNTTSNSSSNSTSGIGTGIMKNEMNRNPRGFSRRPAFRVLTNDILRLKRRSNDKLKSIPGFIRQRRIMQSAQDAHKRNHRARRLGIPAEDCPLPDPVWRRYQNRSVKIADFDLAGCEKEEALFEFGKEVVKQVEAAEIGPDEGIPIDEHSTLPRSFLLDAIHTASSVHCLHLQTKTNRPTNRSECRSPAERAKPLQGRCNRYNSTMKSLLNVTKKRWINASEEAEESSTDESTEDYLSDSDQESEPSQTLSETDPDFGAILTKLLDTPSFLDPVPAYEPTDSTSYAADALWSFDTSSLLAFGVLAEEFMGRMIEAHLKSAIVYKEEDENEEEEEFDSEELL